MHKSRPKILSSVLEHIGMTPLICLSRLAVAEGIECELLAKCEFFNAGGSVKDRIGLRMIEDAESQKRISKGDILIEPICVIFAHSYSSNLAFVRAKKGSQLSNLRISPVLERY